MSLRSSEEPIRIPSLDGWRCVAISLVILHHATWSVYTDESEYWRSLTRFGACGVDIFFGLSGFLITTLLLQEHRQTGSISLRSFYIRRAFRILPPYFALLAAISIAGLWRSGQELAGCLLMFRNYVPDELVGRATQHLWSLAVEEHFYLIWPGLLVLFGPGRGKALAGWFAAAIGGWKIIEQHWNLGAFLHCFIAFVLSDTRGRERFRREVSFAPWIGILILAVTFFATYNPLTSIGAAISIPVLLAGTALNPQWGISQILNLRVVRWIGRISYSLYLWQELFLVPGWEYPHHIWLRWPYNLFATILTASASYYLLERPLLKIGRKLAARESTGIRNPILAAGNP
jgi:peptidoglycan/LPS O-acetylase OafA/YrhL